MNLIFKNIINFFKFEKKVFVIMFMCVFSSAIILNFSYGLYQNYRVQKNESEIDLKEIYIGISKDALLTRQMIEKYLCAISEDTINKMEIIYCSAEIEPYDTNSYGPFYFRFNLKDKKFCIAELTKNIWEKQGLMTSGRYITDEEEATGAEVAIVYNDGNGWNEITNQIKNGEKSIELFGRTFNIVGEQRASGTPIIPFLSIPEDTKFCSFAFLFKTNLKRSTYDELKAVAETTIPNVLVFDEIEFPDTESIYTYNNIMLISALIAILSVINFAMLYHFILQERSRDLAIFRICGCNISKAVIIYLGECFILSVPIYIIGTVLYSNVMHNILTDIFPYMEAAYNTTIYIVIFLIYFIIMLIILSFMIYNHVRKNIIEEWKSI